MMIKRSHKYFCSCVLLLCCGVAVGFAEPQARELVDKRPKKVVGKSQEEIRSTELKVTSPADPWSESGFREMQNNRGAQALEMFDYALERDPGHKSARFGRATALIQLKRYFEAEKTLLDLIADYPKDAIIRNNLAWLYATAEDHRFRSSKKAITVAQEAILLTPTGHHFWSTLSQAYYLDGNYDKALRAAQHVMDLVTGGTISKEEMSSHVEQFDKCKKAKEAMSLID